MKGSGWWDADPQRHCTRQPGWVGFRLRAVDYSSSNRQWAWLSSQSLTEVGMVICNRVPSADDNLAVAVRPSLAVVLQVHLGP